MRRKVDGTGRKRLKPSVLRAFVQVPFALAFLPALAATGGAADALAKYLARTQLVPALAAALTGSAIAIAVSAAILVSALVFGRFYCAALCPLGAVQDASARLAGRGKAKNGYAYRADPRAVRVPVLFAIAAAAASGTTVLVDLLDPFGIFSRGARESLRPLAWAFTRVSRAIADAAGLPSLPIFDLDIATAAFALSVAAFLAVMAVSAFRGRVFCDAVCPAGTILGYCSRIAPFRIRVDPGKCTGCGACERACRTACIKATGPLRVASIDDHRCTRCFDCLSVCPADAIRFGREGKRRTPARGDPARRELTRREFVVAGASIAAGAGLAFAARAIAPDGEAVVALSGIERDAAVPPGAVSSARLSRACTACQLCVARCPTGVIRPAPLFSGLRGPLQPFMDFSKAYCSYDCVVCGNVCPSGAIRPLSLAAKRRVKIGESRFLRSRCIVVSKGTSCGACAERCPTGAVSMTTPLDGSIPEPVLHPDMCIGCGACETSCPAAPLKAIWVAGFGKHRTADAPAKGGAAVVPTEDFPF